MSTVYPVIVEPPLVGAFQVTVTSVPEIAVVGAAGTLGAAAEGNTAPLPAEEAAELPSTFVASTLAETLAPFARL